VRVTVLTDDGEEVIVVLTKNHAHALGIEQDIHVWITPVAGATTVPRMRAVTA
jgi:sulfate transport system ATP-binding protein